MTVGAAPIAGEIEEVVDTRPKEEEEVQTGPDTVVDGPPTPDAVKEKVNEKKLAKIVKEGGKRGVEIEGAADMGGLEFFCTLIDLPEGDVDLLLESVKAMNAKSDPSEEERKGGAGKIGKIVLSCTDDKIAAVAYCPSDKPEKGVKAKEWLEYVVGMICNGPKGVEKIAEFSACGDVSTDNYYKCQMGKDPDTNLFPLKMRDPAISEAYNYLKKKGLFPDGDDDDDDFVFGDDDFPSM